MIHADVKLCVYVTTMAKGELKMRHADTLCRKVLLIFNLKRFFYIIYALNAYVI